MGKININDRILIENLQKHKKMKLEETVKRILIKRLVCEWT